MKAGQALVAFHVGGATHVTCSGARKGWTVCGMLVPPSSAITLRGDVAALKRELRRRTACKNCVRMADASTV